MLSIQFLRVDLHNFDDMVVDLDSASVQAKSMDVGRREECAQRSRMTVGCTTAVDVLVHPVIFEPTTADHKKAWCRKPPACTVLLDF